MDVTEICKLVVTENLEDFSVNERKGIDSSIEAMDNAHAPYSKFRVGAALLYEDGSITTGSNQENPSFPSGLCAERVALFHSLSAYPNKKVTHIFISTSDINNKSHPFAPPCGACLQVIDDVEHRQKSPIKIVLCGAKEFFIASSVRQFMPFRFEF